MPKRTIFTNITPLPPQVSREVAVAMLHDHDEMIELNPLVVEHHPIRTPRDAPADEFLDCVWQELTDKIHYLPGGVVKGKVSYKACFHDLPRGLQTHIYAPLGLDIREKWSIGGTLPGEPLEPRELGLDAPRQGLYLREDCDMSCSRILTGFVRKNLDHAHKVLVERILRKAEIIEEHRQAMIRYSDDTSITTNTSAISSGFQPGSHMATSRIPYNPTLACQPKGAVPHRGFDYYSMVTNHPAFRNTCDEDYQLPSPISGDFSNFHNTQPHQKTQEFIAELPGNVPFEGRWSPSQRRTPDIRLSLATELSSGDTVTSSSSPRTQSDRGSMNLDPRNPRNKDDLESESHYSDRSSEYDTYHSELPISLQDQRAYPRDGIRVV